MSDRIASSVDEVWKLFGNNSQLCLPPLQADVTLSQAELGATQLQWHGMPLAGQLLGISAGVVSETQDSFVRGSDLVLTSCSQLPKQFRWQAYWRAVALDEHRLQLDLIVSLETPLLESFPKFSTRTSLPVAEAWRVAADANPERLAICDSTEEQSKDIDCFVLRGDDSSWSYVEMTDPVDRGQSRLRPAGELACLERELGGSFLEKGVIRRMRIRGILMPRDDDLQQAAQQFAAFRVEEPPLTA